jgi:hypothetical protein
MPGEITVNARSISSPSHRLNDDATFGIGRETVQAYQDDIGRQELIAEHELSKILVARQEKRLSSVRCCKNLGVLRFHAFLSEILDAKTSSPQIVDDRPVDSLKRATRNSPYAHGGGARILHTLRAWDIRGNP